mgnify:CR=1 FL=1
MTKLTDVCDIQYGYAFDSKCFSNDETLPPLVRIRDVKRGYSETFYSGEYPEEYIIHAGDLLVGMDGEFNIARWKSRDALLNQRVCKIVAKDGTNEEYIRFFLSTTLKEIEKRTSFVTVKHLSAKELNKIEINIPNINEQTRIAISLRTLENIITHRRTQLEKLDLLVKARFVEMFGEVATENYKYPTYKLGNVSNVGSSHRVFTSEFVEKGIPFYRGTEIGELASGCKPTEPFYISEEHYNKISSDNTKPQIGDLLMPSICNKGQVWRVDTDEPFYYKDGRVLCISADRDKYNTVFLQFFMREKTIIEYPKLGSGSTFAEFKIFLLKDIDVLTPPIDLQNQFADFVKQVDKSRFITLKENKESEIL